MAADKGIVRKLLIVDDEPDIRGILAFTLEDCGFEVREAADGAQALAALKETPPDLLALDLMMPGVDGFGVLRSRRPQGLAPAARVRIPTATTAARAYGRACGRG